MTTHFSCIEFPLPTGMHSDCRVSPSLPSIALWNTSSTPGGQYILSPEVSAMHPGTARSRVGQGCLTKQQHLICYHSFWGVRKHYVHGDTPERVVGKEGLESR